MGEQDGVLVSSLAEELRTEWKEGCLSEQISRGISITTQTRLYIRGEGGGHIHTWRTGKTVNAHIFEAHFEVLIILLCTVTIMIFAQWLEGK